MKQKVWFLSIFIGILGLFFTSCQEQFQPDKATGEDNTQADNAIADVFFFAQQETSGDKAFVNLDTTCYKVTTTIDTTNLERTTIIEFNNCDVFGNGVIRDGKIIIHWQFGWLFDPTKTVTITFEGFKRNRIQLDGQMTIHFTRESDEDNDDEQTHPVYIITENNMKLTFPDSTTVTWEGERTIKWYAGFNTPFIRNDNVVEISYTRNGINRKGEGFTATAEDLYVDASCEYHLPLKGELTITKEDGTQFTIDFGDGECDNCVVYESGGNEVQVCGD